MARGTAEKMVRLAIMQRRLRELQHAPPPPEPQDGPLTFRQYVDRATRGRFQWYRHAVEMAEVLQRVADREVRNLIVIAPPRHGKSEQVTRLFSGYWAYRFPDEWVGITGYGASLAQGFSRKAREYYLEAGGKIGQKNTDGEWETGQGGGIWADGIRGTLTGRGYHLGVVDDPIKDDKEANSPTYRQSTWEWWDTTFWTRGEPGAARVIVLTRWHHDDLVGRILENEKAAQELGESDGWEVLHLQALRDPEDMTEYPEGVHVYADWREAGEALCPERYAAPALEKRQRSSPRTFQAMYQGSPVAREGDVIQPAWFEIVDEPPAKAVAVRGWDRAATSEGGDWTAGAKLSRDPDGIYYIEDIKRGQWATGKRDRTIRQVAELDGKEVEQAGEQEPGAAGKSDALAFRQNLDGFTTSTRPASGSKVIRAGPWASQAEVGNVRLVRGPWNRDFLEECASFPYGRTDDMVDAVSIAYARLQERRKTPEPSDYPSIKA